jgi:hypothetical protein
MKFNKVTLINEELFDGDQLPMVLSDSMQDFAEFKRCQFENVEFLTTVA